jgi:hypothetical protein
MLQTLKLNTEYLKKYDEIKDWFWKKIENEKFKTEGQKEPMFRLCLCLVE